MVASLRWMMIAAGILALGSLWLRAGFPLTAISSATFDDALFVRTARFLGAGQWLGPYGYLTLVKGMFYPLFILACFLLHVPLLIAEQAVYLVASAGVAALVGRHARPWLGLLLFGVLAFNPVLWNSELQRAIREGLYVSLTPGCVGLTAACVFAPAWRGRLGLAVALGTMLGAFWLTREEGPWLVPALLCIPVVALVPATWRGLARRTRALRMVGPLALAGVLALSMVLGVAAMNWRVYGVFLTTEFQGGAFPKAYGALARITSDQWRPYLVVPPDAAAHAYAVSPAARALSPVLDGPRVHTFAADGCKQMAIDPCPGILASWFMWAMRDAVAEATHNAPAPVVQAFDQRLADEVNGACDAGRIPCGPTLTGFLPPFRRSYVAAAAQAALSVAWMLIKVAPDQIGSLPSHGPAYEAEVFEDMAGPLDHALAERSVVAGRITADGGTPSLAVADPQHPTSETRLVLTAITPIPSGGGAATYRFELQTSCQTGCRLIVIDRAGQTLSVPVPETGETAASSQGGLNARIEQAGAHDPRVTSRALDAGQQRIARAIARVYGRVMPVAFVLAICGLAAALLRPRSAPSLPLVALTLAALVAVASRIALLAILDATSIPAVNVLYGSPASPLVIVFAVVGCWLGWSTVGASRR